MQWCSNMLGHVHHSHMPVQWFISAWILTQYFFSRSYVVRTAAFNGFWIPQRFRTALVIFLSYHEYQTVTLKSQISIKPEETSSFYKGKLWDLDHITFGKYSIYVAVSKYWWILHRHIGIIVLQGHITVSNNKRKLQSFLLQFPAVTYLTRTLGLFQFEIKMTRHIVQRICCQLKWTLKGWNSTQRRSVRKMDHFRKEDK